MSYNHPVRTSLSKLPSGRTRARYYDDEKKWFGETFDLQSEAKDWLAGIRTDRSAGTWASPTLGKMTMNQWWAEWWPTERHLARTTRRNQDDYWRLHLAPVWGEVAIGDITTRSIKAWTATMAGAPDSCRLYYSLFSKMINAAIDAGIIKVSPLPKKRGLPKIRKKPMRILEEPEITALADTIRLQYRAMILCMAYGGFRIGEMAALRIEDIDFTKGAITVKDGQTSVHGVLYYEGPKTDNSFRTVPMPWSVMEELTSHVERFVPDADDPRALLFRARDGSDLKVNTFRNNSWAYAVRDSGIGKLHPHELRHTAVSIWISEGASPVLVAARAGDTIGTVMKVYAHLFAEDHEQLRQRMDKRRQSAAQTPAPAPQRRQADGGATIIPLRPTGTVKN